jgi:hypothetical protein
VAGIGYLPLIPLLLTQLTTAGAWPGYRPPFSLGALTDLLGLMSFGGGLFGMGTHLRSGTLPLGSRVAILLPFVLMLLSGVGGIPGWRRRAFILTYWAVPIVVVASLALRWNIFYERYFSFVLPPFAVLLAAGVAYLTGSAGRKTNVATVVSLLMIIASFVLPALLDVYRTPTQHQWREAARYVSARAEVNDFILFIPAFARIPFDYYFTGPQQRVGLNPRGIRTSAQLAQFRPDFDLGRLEEIARKHERVWIVATNPVGLENRKEIGRAMAPYFREPEGRQFGLVFAFLWESRLYGAPQN